MQTMDSRSQFLSHYLVFTRGVPALFVKQKVPTAPHPDDYFCDRIYYAMLSNNVVYWCDNLTDLFKYVGALPELRTGSGITVTDAWFRNNQKPASQRPLELRV